MSTETIINKYRPQEFSEVMGNSQIVGALERSMATTTHPHAYLLTGPSGIGKTTIARIIGNTLGADITEIDAATHTGVDAMRELVEMGAYASMTGKGVRMFIIDECHMLSKGAWNAILKLLEEPPAHLYLALCTTEQHRVLETIKTRCFHVPLKPISFNEMEDLLSLVCEMEEWKPTDDVVAAVVQAATGQPRKGLSLMQAVHDAPSREEVSRIISLNEVTDPMIDLLKLLMRGSAEWKDVQPLLLKLDDDDWDQAIIGACRYMMGVMSNSKTDGAASAGWRILDALVFPSSTFDKKAAFYTAIGRILWST